MSLSLKDAGARLIQKLSALDRSADKMKADRYYFLVFPEGSAAKEAFHVSAFGYADDADEKAKKRFLVALAKAVHEEIVKQGFLPPERKPLE